MADRPATDGFDARRLAESLGEAPPAPLAMPVQDLRRATPPARALPRLPASVILWRAATLGTSLLAAAVAVALFLRTGAGQGPVWFSALGAGLIFLTTWWLAWGAALALAGALSPVRPVPRAAGPLPKTVLLVPVCDEDAEATAMRIAAIDASLAAIGEAGRFAFAILSDSRSEAVAAAERRAFRRLAAQPAFDGRLWYRRRARNSGRKAGNIADFLAAHGGSWEFAVVLDADSLMEGATLVEMARRLAGAPGLGLLQTLPRITGAGSRFARAQAFSSALYAGAFARGLAAVQGCAGPFWGHNAIFRIDAFTSACGLPDLPGTPPLGGSIMSHDFVEAALLARAGWQVRLDPDLGGSFEETPETLPDHARRDRRWAQGNLQHLHVIPAAGLRPWHRFMLAQGVFAYLTPLLWLGLLAAGVVATLTAPAPAYFADGSGVPSFPVERVGSVQALIGGILALLLLPRLTIALATLRGDRAAAFGGRGALLRSTAAEIALSCLTAPLHLMFATRSVVEILCRRDSGWPSGLRGSGPLTFAEAWRASRFITLAGLAGCAFLPAAGVSLALWLAPVLVPMAAAPLLIAWTSRPGRAFATPQDLAPAPVLRDLQARQPSPSPPKVTPLRPSDRG